MGIVSGGGISAAESCDLPEVRLRHFCLLRRAEKAGIRIQDTGDRIQGSEDSSL
ncbi:MAG: hypothetical protein HY606_05555 [Planctomycetes bacterium]|nr:hypothetical protein [Planctomycetota bacterium]